MTITSVNTSTFLADTTIYLRDQLRSNVTDPISGSRPGASKFVTTSYPRRLQKYPFVVVQVTDFSTPTRAGLGSEMHRMVITIEAQVYARNVVEREEITQAVANHLRSIEHNTGGTIDACLHDFELLSSVIVDEEEEDGEAGIRRRVLTVQYAFIFGAT